MGTSRLPVQWRGMFSAGLATTLLVLVTALGPGCGQENASPEDPAAGLAHLERAYALMDRGEFDRALKDAEQAAKLMPDSTGPLLALGEIYEATGKFGEAAGRYRAVLALDPNVAVAYFKIGFINKRVLKDYATALVNLTRAVELDTTNAVFAFQLADCFHELERYAEAKAYFERAIALNPDHPAAHYGLGEIYEVHMQDPERAFPEYERAIAIDPQEPMYRRSVGLAYARNRNGAQALVHLREFLKLDPDSPYAPAIERLVRQIEKAEGLSR